MATIIEVQDQKMEHLSDYAEKVLKYGGKLMQCLEEITSESGYAERSRRGYMERHGNGYMERYGQRNFRRGDDDEFLRYY